MTPDSPIRILVVDDSSLPRRVLASELGRRPEFSVSACGSGVADVREQLLTQHPDLILLDLGVRATDAENLLAKLRAHYPVPVLVYTDTRLSDRKTVLRVIERGALEVIDRPRSSRPDDVARYVEQLTPRIRSAARNARPVSLAHTRATLRAAFTTAGLDPRRCVVAIGASTGGTEAIRVLLSAVSADFAPIVIVQHMPVGFTASFAERLNLCCAARVTEAVDGEPLRPGCVLIARGDTHLTIRRNSGGWAAHYTEQTLFNGHCPSVDVLFNSVADAGAAAVGVLLTGMGSDGALGLLRIRRAGGLTIAQEASSCVVYGMPRAAVELGAAQHSAPPAEIPGQIVARLTRAKHAAASQPN